MPWHLYVPHLYLILFTIILSYTGGPSLVDKKGDGSKNTAEKKVHINH